MSGVLYNFAEKVGNVYPTRMEMPDWFTLDTLNRIKRLGIFAKVEEVKRVGDFTEEDILDSGGFGEPKTLVFDKVLEWAKANVPVETEPDVVEWMVEATAINAYLLACANEYERAGSFMLVCCDDAYIPGVSVEDIYFASETGGTVAQRGYSVVVTPQGNFNCPVPGKQTIVTKNILAWAAVVKAYIKQWTGVLTKFKDLVVNPQSRIRFPNASGLTGPLFFGHQASRRAFRNIVEMSVTTDKPQTITVTARSPTDYTSTLFSFKQSLQSGQNVIRFKIRSLFGVPPMVMQIDTENGTNACLDYYTVYP